MQELGREECAIKFLKLMAGLAGVMLAATGALLVALFAAGQVREGQTGALISGIGFLVMAAPALATPFSLRAAKRLLMLTLCCLAALAIWLCFWPKEGVTPTLHLRIAVLAFPVLLTFRLFLARHRKMTKINTDN
ncbi:hypothetical protein GUF57_15780 [Xanthomonas citri pv. citri]|nr:hypothetical protein [Xanthomonas citri pv. citri]